MEAGQRGFRAHGKHTISGYERSGLLKDSMNAKRNSSSWIAGTAVIVSIIAACGGAQEPRVPSPENNPREEASATPATIRPPATPSATVEPLWGLVYALAPSDFGMASNNAMFSVTWSPDGKRVATGDGLGSLIVWDPNIGEMIHHLPSGRYVKACDWSPNASMLVCGSGTDLWVWDPDAGVPIVRMSGVGGRIQGVQLSPDGLRVASWATYEKSGRIWSMTTGVHLHALPNASELVELAWSPDGSSIASANSGSLVTIWDATNAQKVGELVHQDRIYDIEWSPNGDSLAVGHLAGVSIWNAPFWSEGEPTALDIENARFVRWSSDGNRLAVVTKASQVELWDVSGENPIYYLLGPSAFMFDIAWSPDGQWLAAGYNNQQVAVWDTFIGEWSGLLMHKPEDINALAWSPDGKLLASVADDGILRLWSLNR